MVKNSDRTPILEKMKEQLPRIKEKVAKATQRYERKQRHIDYRYRYIKRNVVTWKSDRNILWKNEQVIVAKFQIGNARLKRLITKFFLLGFS